MYTDLCLSLLPSPHHLRLDTINLTTQPLSLHVTSTQLTPPCPTCGTAGHRLHSGYIRTLADLPWAGNAARIFVQVRRFFCDQATCARRTFTERLPGIAAHYARRTERLATKQSGVGLALGGAAGARLTAEHGMATSRNTLLRLVRALPIPEAAPVRVIGIDDWAQRKGHTYGTIIIDLERHQPLDLLPDRTAATVATWLFDHPTVEVISRDRAEAYAAGATAGAPAALQVADRFHLLKNLREAVEQELSQRGVSIPRTPTDDPSTLSSPALVAVDGGPSRLDGTSAPATGDDRPLVGRPSPRCRVEVAREAHRNERLAQYQELLALQEGGLDQGLIARRLGISRRTIQRWRATPGFPERKPRSGETSCLDGYKVNLLERWGAGCHNMTHLWRTIQAQGFPGSYGLVARFLAPLRRGEALPVLATAAPVAAGARRPAWYTARQAAFLFLRTPSERTPSEEADLLWVHAAGGSVATIATLTQDFATMLRERQPACLDAWLGQAATSACPELERFANGIRRDYAAVRAGLAGLWSQGQVEGNVTRLKLLKRQMYGRAKLDLLRRRVLLAA